MDSNKEYFISDLYIVNTPGVGIKVSTRDEENVLFIAPHNALALVIALLEILNKENQKCQRN